MNTKPQKYRRIPTEVEAVQFLCKTHSPEPFFEAFNFKFPMYGEYGGGLYIIVPTKSGQWRVHNGDWLVLDGGYLIVVKDEMFKQTFESI